jgi:TPP-dependent pyruvate/acetoin dehydrogenase alpha subunit
MWWGGLGEERRRSPQGEPVTAPHSGAATDLGRIKDLYRTMLRIRRVEERIRDLYAAGRMPGFIHLSIGQEAVASGAAAASPAPIS